MPLDRAFRFSIYVVVALAGLALGAGDLLSPPALAVFLVALVATWWLHDALGPRAYLSQRGDITATLTLTTLAIADFIWIADSFLDTFARLVCALLLVRLTTWRVTRERNRSSGGPALPELPKCSSFTRMAPPGRQ